MTAADTLGVGPYEMTRLFNYVAKPVPPPAAEIADLTDRLGLEPVRRSTVQGEEAGRFYVFPVTLLRWGMQSEARAAARRGRPSFPPRRPPVGDLAPPTGGPVS